MFLYFIYTYSIIKTRIDFIKTLMKIKVCSWTKKNDAVNKPHGAKNGHTYKGCTSLVGPPA